MFDHAQPTLSGLSGLALIGKQQATFAWFDARAAEAPPPPCIAEGNQTRDCGALVTKPARADDSLEKDQTRSPFRSHENLTHSSPGVAV
jgi:hypothetical protein